MLPDIPKKAMPGVEVRGEVYMRLSRFRERYAAEFANPRNLAAGAQHKEPSKSAEYGLSFFAYDLLGAGARTEGEKIAAAVRRLRRRRPSASTRAAISPRSTRASPRAATRSTTRPTASS